jgi:hypothetical protein
MAVTNKDKLTLYISKDSMELLEKLFAAEKKKRYVIAQKSFSRWVESILLEHYSNNEFVVKPEMVASFDPDFE